MKTSRKEEVKGGLGKRERERRTSGSDFLGIRGGGGGRGRRGRRGWG